MLHDGFCFCSIVRDVVMCGVCKQDASQHDIARIYKIKCADYTVVQQRRPWIRVVWCLCCGLLFASLFAVAPITCSEHSAAPHTAMRIFKQQGSCVVRCQGTAERNNINNQCKRTHSGCSSSSGVKGGMQWCIAAIYQHHYNLSMNYFSYVCQ
jgi:hypothetical protein